MVITPAEAKWILETIDLAASEGLSGTGLTPADIDALTRRLTDFAGTSPEQYWWLNHT